MTRRFDSAAALADALLDTVGREIVLGLPVGIGKGLHVADALVERALADPGLSLTIFTGLTLAPPRAGPGLERRFLEPLNERLYADWPVPAYAELLSRDALPANIRVREFYLRPGAYLDSRPVQRGYTSINYSQVADELLALGVNVIAQLVAERPASPGCLSLGSNPDVTLDLLPRLAEARRAGRAVALVGQVNRNMPYMTGDAELPGNDFDFVLDGPDFPLFGMPARPVLPADFATGMHVASLVRDGGTLQLGIGSLSEAVAHCLRLRQREPEVFAHVLERLPGGSRSDRRAVLPVETAPFDEGLYAATELLSDAIFALFREGIVRRPADNADSPVVHAGFFIGSPRFYSDLRELPEHDRRRIGMTRISFVNTLFGDERAKRQQRRHGRFVNETMMATLLGAAVSDALDDGRVVSGVGGQFDFVAMAQALEDAHSILMVRARRRHRGVPQSNIRWSYGHTTVPRHCRDVFVTEYGIAATRGRSDRDVIEAMLGIADAAFQQELVAAARKSGKLPADFRLPADAADNTPERLESLFTEPDIAPHFPRYPLGTDFTPVEQSLVEALTWLSHHAARPLPRIAITVAALLRGGRGHDEAVERMGLDRAQGWNERLQRALLCHALEQTSS